MRGLMEPQDGKLEFYRKKVRKDSTSPGLLLSCCMIGCVLLLVVGVLLRSQVPFDGGFPLHRAPPHDFEVAAPAETLWININVTMLRVPCEQIRVEDLSRPVAGGRHDRDITGSFVLTATDSDDHIVATAPRPSRTERPVAPRGGRRDVHFGFTTGMTRKQQKEENRENDAIGAVALDEGSFNSFLIRNEFAVVLFYSSQSRAAWEWVHTWNAFAVASRNRESALGNLQIAMLDCAATFQRDFCFDQGLLMGVAGAADAAARFYYRGDVEGADFTRRGHASRRAFFRFCAARVRAVHERDVSKALELRLIEQREIGGLVLDASNLQELLAGSDFTFVLFLQFGLKSESAEAESKWDMFALEAAEELPFITVAKLYCEVGSRFCEKQLGIHRFPTMRLFHGEAADAGGDYSKTFSVGTLLSFATARVLPMLQAREPPEHGRRLLSWLPLPPPPPPPPPVSSIDWSRTRADDKHNRPLEWHVQTEASTFILLYSHDGTTKDKELVVLWEDLVHIAKTTMPRLQFVSINCNASPDACLARGVSRRDAAESPSVLCIHSTSSYSERRRGRKYVTAAALVELAADCDDIAREVSDADRRRGEAQDARGGCQVAGSLKSTTISSFRIAVRSSSRGENGGGFAEVAPSNTSHIVNSFSMVRRSDSGMRQIYKLGVKFDDESFVSDVPQSVHHHVVTLSPVQQQIDVLERQMRRSDGERGRRATAPRRVTIVTKEVAPGDQKSGLEVKFSFDLSPSERSYKAPPDTKQGALSPFTAILQRFGG